MERDPYAGLLHTGNGVANICSNVVERLNQSFSTLLRTHESLKAQNDDTLVRVGMEQQFALNPVMKGKQIEEDTYRGGIGEKASEDPGETREPVGLVATARR